MRYFLVKTPRLLKAAFQDGIWHIVKNANSVYLTFDDGPHPTITPFVLKLLKKYNAKATFFCIGKNVELYPEIFQQIIDEGHSVGNHTHNHLNGWKTTNEEYFNNIDLANVHIHSKLFRPPYGRITSSQVKGIHKFFPELKIIMWDILTGDFDVNLSPEKCFQLSIKKVKEGSIIVFHDSEKAFARLEYALPKFLQYCTNMGWQMKSINNI